VQGSLHAFHGAERTARRADWHALGPEVAARSPAGGASANIAFVSLRTSKPSAPSLLSRPRALGYAAALLLGALGAGCGDDTSDTSSSGPGSGGGGTGGAGAGGESAGAGGGGGSSKEYAGYGYVTASSYAYTQPTSYAGYVASAGFSMGVGSSQGYECVLEAVEGCTVTECDYTGGGGGGGLTLLDAGVVTITGGAQTVTLSADASKLYGSVTSGVTPLFDGGETLSVSAAGSADLPAWSGTVVAPAPADFTAPSFDGNLTIQRSSTLSVAWTGGGAGQVRFFVATAETASGQTTRTVSVSCEAPASAGAMSVPAAALGRLSPTGANVSATASASVTSTTNLEVGEILVSLVAVNAARGNGAGGQASALATVL